MNCSRDMEAILITAKTYYVLKKCNVRNEMTPDTFAISIFVCLLIHKPHFSRSD